MIELSEISIRKKVELSVIIDLLYSHFQLETNQIVNRINFYDDVHKNHLMIAIEVLYSEQGYKTFVQLDTRFKLSTSESVSLALAISKAFNSEVAIPDEGTEFENSVIIVSAEGDLYKGSASQYDEDDTYETERGERVSIDDF